MNSDWIGIYWLVVFLPIEVFAICVFSFAGWFVYAGREFVEGCPIGFNVSRCSVYGGFALAVCLYLAATALQQGDKMISFTNSWPYQIILFILCLSVGMKRGGKAKKSSDPQFFVDWVNNYVAIPLQIFLFFTMIISSFEGTWTWRQPTMFACLVILIFTFCVDASQGRLQQRTWLADNSSVIISWFKGLSQTFTPAKIFRWKWQ